MARTYKDKKNFLLRQPSNRVKFYEEGENKYGRKDFFRILETKEMAEKYKSLENIINSSGDGGDSRNSNTESDIRTYRKEKRSKKKKEIQFELNQFEEEIN